jgi:hypothetical protein
MLDADSSVKRADQTRDLSRIREGWSEVEELGDPSAAFLSLLSLYKSGSVRRRFPWLSLGG